MKPNNVDQPATDEPRAELERQLIGAYLAGAGQDFHELMMRDDAAAKQLLAEASLFASDRMSEIEARLHFLRKLHGAE